MAKTHTSSGTLTQNFSMEFLIPNYNEDLSDDKETALIAIFEKGINQQAHNACIDEIYYEDDAFHANGSYETSYKSTYIEATRLDPPEYDMERTCDYLSERLLEDFVNANTEHTGLTIEDLSVTENEDDYECDEYEPDPDMMPGGHDYY